MNKLSARFARRAQKGFIPLPIIIGAMILLTVGYVGVQQGFIPFISAPSTRWATVGPYDRDPVKFNPTPSPTPFSDVINPAAGDDQKPALSIKTATKVKGNYKTYESSEYGYSITYPTDWELFDGNTQTSRQILVKQFDGLATVDIQAFFDKALSDTKYMQSSMDAMNGKIKGTPGFTVDKYDSAVVGNQGRYAITGTQTISSVGYNFINMGELATDGRVIVFHGVYKKSAPAGYDKKVLDVITSFKTD